MKTGSRIEHGTELIQNLKDHLIRCLESQPEGSTGVSVKDLQDYSGLTNKGRVGDRLNRS